MSTPRYPAFFQVNMGVRFSELSGELGRDHVEETMPVSRRGGLFR